MLESDHCSGLLFFVKAMLHILSTISYNSQFLSTSGGILLGPGLLPCFRVDFALAYSSSVNVPSSISRSENTVGISSSESSTLGASPRSFLK